MKAKLFWHVIAFLLEMGGLVLLHVNPATDPMIDSVIFLGIRIYCDSFVFDMGIFCMIAGFIVEFLSTFKPMEVKE